ncbi:Glucosamine-6-phosphate isomerase (Glucosamine-6-phosphate deaminase) (GNPDA) (GlcN6P deaminase) [Clarireedia jacksonii]
MSRSTYVRDASDGETAFLYIIDTGEFDTTLPVVGGTYGIARKALPQGYVFQWAESHMWFIDALDQLQSDWDKESQGGQFVKVLSLSLGYPGVSEQCHNALAAKLKVLSDMNMLVLCSAGNDDTYSDQPIDTFPALFGDSQSSNKVENLLVVGSINNYGSMSNFSAYAPWVDLYVPGECIEFPQKDGEPYLGQGTSTATAKAAGLAAYFLGLTSIRDQVSTASKLREYMLSDKAILNLLGLKSIYNGAP